MTLISPILQVRSLRYENYLQQQQSERAKQEMLFRNLNFDVYRGETVGLVADISPSTLMQCLCKMIEPSKGSVTWTLVRDFKRHDSCRDMATPDIAYLPVTNPDLSFVTVAESVANFIFSSALVSQHRLFRMLKLFRLFDVRNHQLQGLPPAICIRLLIAQAFLSQPGVLLIDQLLDSVDHGELQNYRRLFARLNRFGRTVIVASRSSEVAAHIGGRVLELQADGGCSKSTGRLVRTPLIS